MAKESKKCHEDVTQQLNTWIATIPFSKPKKNLTRDFSDAVLMAEVLKVYFPRYVDLHNYVPANSVTAKTENWNILNRRVLTKIDMKLTKDTINQLVNAQPGVAEQLLLDLKNKIVKEPVQVESPSNINDSTLLEQENEEIARVEESTSPTLISNESVFIRTRQKFLLVVTWLINWISVWRYWPGFRTTVRGNSSRNAQENEQVVTSAETKSAERGEEDSIPRQHYAQLRRELCEKDDIISTLNHKVAYLESSMKLRDLRISNLTSQILQNAVDSEQTVKDLPNDSPRSKLRPRSQNAQDVK